VTLLGRGESDDAVWCPLVWSQDGRRGVLTDERQLCEVVVLFWDEYMCLTKSLSYYSYTQQLLQRVDDLVGLNVPEDVDDLAMAPLLVRIDDIPQCERLPRGNDSLSCGRQPCFWIYDDLESDVAGVRLAGDVRGYALLQRTTEGG
jgi:hypothetical protein